MHSQSAGHRCYSGLFKCACGVTMNLSTPSASPASARTYQPPDAEGSFGGSFRPSEPAPATAPPPNVGPRPLKADREDSFCCPTCSHVHMGYRPTLQTSLPAPSRAIARSISLPSGCTRPCSSCARAAPSHSYPRRVPAGFPCRLFRLQQRCDTWMVTCRAQASGARRPSTGQLGRCTGWRLYPGRHGSPACCAPAARRFAAVCLFAAAFRLGSSPAPTAALPSSSLPVHRSPLRSRPTVHRLARSPRQPGGKAVAPQSPRRSPRSSLPLPVTNHANVRTVTIRRRARRPLPRADQLNQRHQRSRSVYHQQTTAASKPRWMLSFLNQSKRHRAISRNSTPTSSDRHPAGTLGEYRVHAEGIHGEGTVAANIALQVQRSGEASAAYRALSKGVGVDPGTEALNDYVHVPMPVSRGQVLPRLW